MGESIFYLKKHYMIGYIYLIIDLKNWKKYVGQHHYHIEGQLDTNYHGSGHIIKMIYSKRPETLKEVYLKTCYSQTELDEWEKYFIFLYDTLWPNGYNLEEGGRGGVPSEETRRKMSEAQKGKHLSDETRKKLSESKKNMSEETRRKMGGAHKGKHLSEEHKKKIGEANKGKTLSEEARKKMSDAKKGKPPHNKGIPMSEESKRKISDAKKGKPSPNKGKPMSEEQKKKRKNGKKSKKVLQFTLDGVFIREWPSTMECERNGFYNTNVSACCRGKKPQYKGFIWKYKD